MDTLENNQSQDENDDNTRQTENDDSNQSHNNGMTLLTNAASEETTALIHIMGSKAKYARLIDLVQSFKEYDDKMEDFKGLWESVEQAHSAIENLENSPAFFAIFLRTRRSHTFGFGETLLYSNYATTSFSAGLEKNIDIRRIL